MADGKNYREDGRFREYVKWKALPRWKRKEMGEPDTETEWAEERGMAQSTLWRWRQTDDYKEMMEQVIDTWVRDSVPKAVKSAEKVAEQDDPKGHNDRKLLLEMAGQVGHMTVRHEGTIEHEHSVDEVRKMTESQLREAMRAELRKKPKFADASDEELDELIDAFAEINTTPGGDSLPGDTQAAEKSPEYILADPPDDFNQNSE